MQSLVPALYPILKSSYGLSFGQIGLITLAFQFTASMLQPVVGLYTDRSPQPYPFLAAMAFPLPALAWWPQRPPSRVVLPPPPLSAMAPPAFTPKPPAWGA